MHYSEHFKYKYSQTSYYCFINVRIKSKVVQKINCEGNQIREICSSVHLDVWSSRSPKKYDPVWLWMHASTLTDWWSCSGAWWKYHRMRRSLSLQLHLPLDWSGYCKGGDWMESIERTTKTMQWQQTCVCPSALSWNINSFTLHLIQSIEHQWNLLDLHSTLFSKRNSKSS